MAVVNRSLDNASSTFTLDREFFIEPEYLEIEEIKNELRARNLPASGDRRTLTGKLRQCISDERKTPGAQKMFVVGTPTTEFELCSRGVNRIKLLLEQVSLEATTQERFMTVFLHYEGRVNRIPKKDKDLNLTDVIFKKNEEFSELYNEFVQRLKTLARARHADQPPGEANEISTGGNVSQQPIGIEQNMSGTIPRTNKSTNTQPPQNSVYSTRGRGAHGPSRGARRSQPNLSLQAHSIPNIQVPQPSSSNPNQVAIFQDISNDVDQNDQLGNANATMNTNDDARLSAQFVPGDMPQITPITIDTNQNESQQAPQWNGLLQMLMQSNNYGESRVSSLPNSLDSNRSQSAHQWNGPLQILVPPDSYGQNRANSLPNYLSFSAPAQNLRSQNHINDMPQVVSHQPANLQPPYSNVGNTYNVGHGQLQHNNQANANQAILPAGPLPSSNSYSHAPLQPNHLSQASNVPNQSIIPVVSLPPSNSYSHAPPQGDSRQSHLGTSNGVPPQRNNGIPMNGTPHNYQQDIVPTQNVPLHNILTVQPHGQQSNQPVNSMEETLKSIASTLSALSNEMIAFRQWRDSFASNSVRVNEQAIQGGNPNATVTLNPHQPQAHGTITRGVNPNAIHMPSSHQSQSNAPGGNNAIPNDHPVTNSNQFRINGPINAGTNPNTTYTVNNGIAPFQANDSQASFSRGSSNFVPIHKWNWKFSADKTSEVPERRDLAAFLKKLELYRQAEQLTYDQIHQKFHFLIDGCVYEWYMQYRHNFANWDQLLEGLKKQFTTPLTHFMKVAKLAARRQKKDESAMEYIASIQRDFDEMGMYSEKEKISIIQNGLNDRLRNVAIFGTWNTVQDMDLHLRSIEVADELRKETDLQIQKRPIFYRRSIHAIESEGQNELGAENNENDAENEYELETDDQPVECQAIMAKQRYNANQKGGNNTDRSKETQTRKATCFNCKSEQHRLVDCEEPITRIFCFRCGKEGARAPNCTCGPKNSKNVACSTTEACDAQQTL